MTHPRNDGVSRFLDVFVDQVFDQFLAATAAGVWFALVEHVGFQVGEVDFSGFDLCSDAAVPTAVAVVNDFGQAAFFDDLRRDLCSASERVHAADVGVEEVDRFEAFSTDFRVEVDPAGCQAALFQDDQHALRGEVDVGRELVGVPAEQQVAGVGVDAAQVALHR